MSLSRFTFTERARPFCEIGIGDIRVGPVAAVWDVDVWDGSGLWGGSEPEWLDVSCYVEEVHTAEGRSRTEERFIAGRMSLIVNNETGLFDPNVQQPVAMRPGRQIRVGIHHVELGRCVLWRGYIDSMEPIYSPTIRDAVELICIDAFGEYSRTELTPLDTPVGDAEPAYARVARILDTVPVPPGKQRIDPMATTRLRETVLGGQIADLLGVVVDSTGGAAYADHDANIVFRANGWQNFDPGSAPDGVIGNSQVGNDIVEGEQQPNDILEAGVQVAWFADDAIWGYVPADTWDQVLWFGDQVIWGYVYVGVCPVGWERPYRRADVTTRVILDVPAQAPALPLHVQKDDPTGQAYFGVEPLKRSDLITNYQADLDVLGAHLLKVRGYATLPRVSSVTLDASTDDEIIDLLATTDIGKPSRYRCVLVEPRGTIFDVEHFATGIAHDITSSSWSVAMNLDLAWPYAAAPGPGEDRWDSGSWDATMWAGGLAALIAEARDLIGAMT